MAESRLCHTAWSELCHKQMAIMKHITTLILALFASNMFSEEFSNISQEDINNIPYHVTAINIPSRVRYSEIAGVGEFVNIPSPTNPVVDISVQQWWTANPGTNNMLRIHGIDETETNWIFPTNVPIVFFATAASNVVINTCIGETLVEHMNHDERAQWMFKHVDRSWFRVSRDNGLMYSFATNLWQHTRVTPNITNQYELFRDVYRLACNDILLEQSLPSWRVAYDSYEGLDAFTNSESENFLAEMMIDPWLPEDMQDGARIKLKERFNWYVDTNGVFRAPDTAALYLSSSNFTAQALAVWRTHDTNNIVLFAKNEVAIKTTPETLLFCGAVSYYLENDFATATNLIFSACQIVNETNIYTPKQKKAFRRFIDYFSIVYSPTEPMRFPTRRFYIDGQYLEDFMEEHSSESGIFEKFGGEFPFSNTLKTMYSRE